MKIELYYVAHYTYVMGQLRTATFNDKAAALEDYEKKKSKNYVGLNLFKKIITDTDIKILWKANMYDVVTNPIPRSNLWATPTLEQIQEQIEAMPSKEKATMYLVFQMTMNACNKLVEDEILSKEVFA